MMEEDKVKYIARRYLYDRLIEMCEDIQVTFAGNKITNKLLCTIQSSLAARFNVLYLEGFLPDPVPEIVVEQSDYNPTSIKVLLDNKGIEDFMNNMFEKYGYLNLALRWFVLANDVNKENVTLFLTDNNETVRSIAAEWCKIKGFKDLI